MARRHLTLTFDFTLDEDTCRDNDDTLDDDGTTAYTRAIDVFRTDVQRLANTTFLDFDPNLDIPVISFHGHTYEYGA